MIRILLALLFFTLNVCSPAYAGTQSIIKADLIEGIDTIKNYIGSKGHFEKSINGWTGYDSTTANPGDCTTAGFDGSIARSTLDPLSGDASLDWAKTGGVSRLGNGIKTDFTIDSKDRGGVLKVQFDYLPDSNFSDDQLAVFIYDVTNSRLIEPSPNKIKHSLVATQIQPLEFQTSIDSSSYRLCIHTIGTSTANWTMKLDSIKISKSQNGSGVFVSDWQSYTPTVSWTGGVASTTAKYRRVGDSIEIDFFLELSGAPSPATSLTVSTPPGLSIDATKIPNTTSERNAVGSGIIYDNAGGSLNARFGLTPIGSSSTSFVFMSVDDVNTTTHYLDRVTPTFPFTFAVADTIQARMVVPIVGWSSNQKLSSDALIPEVVAIYEVNASTSNSSFADNAAEIVDYNNKIIDNSNAVTTGASWKFTAPVSGNYSVSANILWNTTTNLSLTFLEVYKNGVFNRRIAQTNHTTNHINGTQIFNLNAGDYIDIRAVQDDSTSAARAIVTGSGYSTVSIRLERGPQQIAASETVAASYYNTAGTSIASTGAVVPFATKTYDYTNSFNGTVFTALVSGLYEVKASLYIQSAAISASAKSLQLRRNGAIHKYMTVMVPIAATNSYGISGSSFVFLNTGDTVDIYFQHNEGTARLLDTTPGVNNFSITRIGL